MTRLIACNGRESCPSPRSIRGLVGIIQQYIMRNSPNYHVEEGCNAADNVNSNTSISTTYDTWNTPSNQEGSSKRSSSRTMKEEERSILNGSFDMNTRLEKFSLDGQIADENEVEKQSQLDEEAFADNDLSKDLMHGINSFWAIILPITITITVARYKKYAIWVSEMIKGFSQHCSGQLQERRYEGVYEVCPYMKMQLDRMFKMMLWPHRSYLVYGDAEQNSGSSIFGRSLINAVVLIGAIAILTFGMVLLYKYNCTKVYLYLILEHDLYLILE